MNYCWIVECTIVNHFILFFFGLSDVPCHWKMTADKKKQPLIIKILQGAAKKFQPIPKEDFIIILLYNVDLRTVVPSQRRTSNRSISILCKMVISASKTIYQCLKNVYGLMLKWHLWLNVYWMLNLGYQTYTQC